MQNVLFIGSSCAVGLTASPCSAVTIPPLHSTRACYKQDYCTKPFSSAFRLHK